MEADRKPLAARTRTLNAALLCCLFVACSEKKSAPVIAEIAARRAENARVLATAKEVHSLRKLDREAIRLFIADAGQAREPLIEALASSCHARVAAQAPVREALKSSAAISVTCSQAECAEPLEALYETTVQLNEVLRSLERDTTDPCAPDFAENFDTYIERVRTRTRR